MAVFSCAPTQRSSDSSSPVRWTRTAPFRVIVVAVTFGLAGCNANHEVNPSSQTASQVFAGHYVDTNPYNPISYAQNNTGIGGGR
jgi:hypothetical protein